ncbi:hypothetical protein ACIOHO_32350 [Streptomyces sp. NPDC087849]|uniref:hypothetical protein n=1 Tax=Streptomyces sp. NPDC087849 TaxID=3365808 RepID=UPI0038037056
MTTVPEQAMELSGKSKNTLPTGAAQSWYGVFSRSAPTGAGSGSVTPWSPERSPAAMVFAFLGGPTVWTVLRATRTPPTRSAGRAPAGNCRAGAPMDRHRHPDRAG